MPKHEMASVAEILSKRYVTPVELEVIHSFSQSTQAKLRMAKKIPFLKIGGYVRYDLEEIETWLNNHAIVSA